MYQIKNRRCSSADIRQIEVEDYAHKRRVQLAEQMNLYTSPSETRCVSYAAEKNGGRIGIMTDRSMIVISEDDARLMAMELPLILERFDRRREREGRR